MSIFPPMPHNEKRFRIISIALSIFILAILSFALFAPTHAIEFDPGGNYKRALNLPDTDLDNLTIRLIQYALGFMGTVAVAIIIWGGFVWMTSAGNEERVKKAKEVIKWAVVGMVVVMLAWAIVVFVFTSIQENSLPASPVVQTLFPHRLG